MVLSASEREPPAKKARLAEDDKDDGILTFKELVILYQLVHESSCAAPFVPPAPGQLRSTSRISSGDRHFGDVGAEAKQDDSTPQAPPVAGGHEGVGYADGMYGEIEQDEFDFIDSLTTEELYSWALDAGLIDLP
jgi:hypothetical protein